MGYFNSQIITKAGAELLAKASAGKKIVFDKMYTGSGQYTVKEIAELLNATDLKEPQQSFAISSCDQEHEQIRLRATISNNGLQKGYDITEIGLYAKEDGKESVLVAISIYTDNKPTHLPQFEDTLVEIYVSNVLAFSGDGNFSIEYRSDVYVTTQEFREEIDRYALQDNLDTHVNDQESHVTPEERKGWNKAKKHAESTHARADATKVEKSTTNGNIKINGTETTVYTHPSGTNPHGTTKNDVGLGNVDNTADANKSVKYATSAGSADAVAWSDVSGKPSTYSPSSHTHSYLPLSGGTVTGDVTVTGILKGENDGHTNHALLLGHNAQDYTNFYEYGGLFQFYKSQNGTDTLLGKISVDGWEGKVNGHTVNADVPSDAKFTDTNTWRPQPDWNAISGDAAIKNKPTLGNASSKTVRTLSAVGDSNWKESAIDQGYVPDMNFIAYWNGAWNSAGGSNLAHCIKGPFGTAATANREDFAAARHIHSNYITRITPDMVKNALGTLLPEYEEGIWTPTFSVGAAGLSGSTGNCVYKKIGNVVHVQAYAKISGGGSMVSVGGFPYRIETSGDSSYGSLQSTPIQCYIGNATTPKQLVSFNGSSSVVIPSVNVSNNTPLIINGYYFTDE